MNKQRQPRTFTVPEGLESAVLAILDVHRGIENAIGRGALVWNLRMMGRAEHERVVRECIKQLRRKGHLICSVPGKHGGYYIATSKREFLEFDQDEFGAKIADMNETRQAMLKAMREQFGEAIQGRLI